MSTQLWSVGVILLSTFFSSLGSFYMKVASSKLKFQIKTVITNMPLIGALSLHTISAILGVIAYKGGELTVLVPLGSFNYVWTSLLAVYFLDEKMNKWKWVGIASIMVGVTLLGVGDIL